MNSKNKVSRITVYVAIEGLQNVVIADFSNPKVSFQGSPSCDRSIFWS